MNESSMIHSLPRVNRLAEHLQQEFVAVGKHLRGQYAPLDETAPHGCHCVKLHLVEVIEARVAVNYVLERVVVKVLVLFLARVLELSQNVDKVFRTQCGILRLEQALYALVHFVFDFFRVNGIDGGDV